MSTTTPPAAAVKPRSRAEAFSALIRDPRVGHGAFRVWHCLRDHQNPRTGLCCPGQRRISEQIGCDPHSLKRWTDELITTGWLALKAVERGEVFRYELLDGQGEVLQKTATGGVVKNRNTPHRWGKPQHSAVEKRYTVMGKTTTKLRGANAPPKKYNNITAALQAGPACADAQQASDAAADHNNVTGKF